MSSLERHLRNFMSVGISVLKKTLTKLLKRGGRPMFILVITQTTLLQQ